MIQPLALQDNFTKMQVDPCLVVTVVSSIGAPQGTVLSPLPFTLYTSDFCYNSELFNIQKFASEVYQGQPRGGVQESGEEFRCLVPHEQPAAQHLKDRGTRSRPVALIEGDEVEVVENYKYTGLWLDNKLDWTSNTRQCIRRPRALF